MPTANSAPLGGDAKRSNEALSAITAHVTTDQPLSPSETSPASLFLHSARSPVVEDTPEEPLEEDQYGHFHGGSSGFAFLQFAKQRLSNLPAMSLQFVDHPLTESNTLPAILPLKKVADTLVAGFFGFGLTTSRFVHKPTFMATFERLYSYDELNKLEYDDLALVYMVLALGSHYSPVNNAFCGFAARYVYSWCSFGPWLQG